MNEEFLDILVALKKELLRTIYANETAARTHVRIHCPLCGDSVKSPNGTHCYVNIEGGKPISYYCQLCGEGGWVGSSFLRSLNIEALNLLVGVRKYNKVFGKALMNGDGDSWRKAKHNIISTSARTVVPIYKNRIKDYEFKLNYIGERLGVDIGYDDIPKHKMVLSLKDFLEKNSIKFNRAMMRTGNLIEEQYVGFLSMDGTYIIFRNTKKDGNQRYINYPIFPKIAESTKSYLMPMDVDFMQNDITFNVTEGIMDLLGCYYHIEHQNRTNVIYGAVNGSGFLGFIKRIIRMGFIDNINLKLYSDLDKGISYHSKLKTLDDLYKSIAVYYNHFPGEKDTGVTADRIDERKIKMSALERKRW